MPASPRIFTIGHSNHDHATFLRLLLTNQVECLVDVRRFPGSRKHPQFNKEELAAFLSQHGIDYRWLGEALGGSRTGGYEQFTRSEEFQSGIQELEGLARCRTVAVMCAEADYRGCHRRFIADTLCRRGWNIFHIQSSGKVIPHQGALL
ncbi:MAG: DUF488 domain-containing protein [Calditrichaeota bacterium]|nr:MAG: DUF488 domain-containing protein [Calditrichota bacterium]